MVLNESVLVLNQNYEPMNVCSVRRALVLMFRGKAQAVASADATVRTVAQNLPAPSVVRLDRYVNAPRRRVVLSKRNVLKRANHQCQYCGKADRKMTIDHVIPRKYKGPETWENLVAACTGCNAKKGHRRLDQAELSLISKPRSPNNVSFIRNFIGVSDSRWKPYLFAD